MSKLDRSTGFTLVELLVVISIISLLVAITVPAISAARESARMSTCKHNQHQLWVGFASHADRTGKYCSGAFNWRGDGAVTEVGWVSDLVKQGTIPGKLLCPSNPLQLSDTYNDLLYATDTSIFTATCLPLETAKGTQGTTLPDGTAVENPCRKILTGNGGAMMAVGDARREVVEKLVYEPGYNTNYTASWYLVRGQPLLSGGRLRTNSTCTPSILERHSTLGPLPRAVADSGGVPQSTVPFLGCGGPSKLGFLNDPVGAADTGKPLVDPITDGPTDPTTMTFPNGPAGHPYDGPDGMWARWNRSVQDYRDFAPVHRGSCNILFADGSVRSFEDANDDGLLNSGFEPSSTNGFKDNTVELSVHEVFNRWELRPAQLQ